MVLKLAVLLTISLASSLVFAGEFPFFPFLPQLSVSLLQVHWLIHFSL